MRWAVFLAAAVIALVFDTGAAEALRIEKLWNIRPGLCPVVVVFVALSAPRTPALWACLVLGVLRDLSNPLTTATGGVAYLVGPYALGFVAAAWVILQLRASVFRRRPLTLGVMTLLCLLITNGFVLVLCGLRATAWYPGGPLYWTDHTTGVEIVRRLLIAVYSALLAIPVGWLLVRSMPLWGFQGQAHRSPVLR